VATGRQDYRLVMMRFATCDVGEHPHAWTWRESTSRWSMERGGTLIGER
jgi:hypothetical protein